MSEEQRQLMKAHMAGLEGRQEASAGGSQVAEPDAGQRIGPANREGSSDLEAGGARQVPLAPGGVEPQQNRSPPADAS